MPLPAPPLVVVLAALRELESALSVYARDPDRESKLKIARARAATTPWAAVYQPTQRWMATGWHCHGNWG
jgi:hypothetical protein